MEPQNTPKQRTVRVSDEPLRPNTLGLCARDLAGVLDSLDSAADARGAKPPREFVRWPFRLAAVTLRISHPGGSASSLTVACRNISRGGMSVLHRAYLHAGTGCVVGLPRSGLPPLEAAGSVVRCRHHSGLIHELGIRFTNPVDVRALLRPAPFTDSFALERVAPGSLLGTVVCIDPSEEGQAFVRQVTRPTNVRVRPAGSIAEALPLIRAGCDLVLCEFSLPDGTAADLIGLLRGERCETPVIVATADTGPSMRERLAGLDIAASLAKPLDEPLLLRAVGEFMPQDGGSERARPVHLATASLHALRRCATKLTAAVEGRDAAACGALCEQILETALDAGEPKIAALARKAWESLLRTESVERSAADLRAAAAACRRAGLGDEPTARADNAA